MKTFLAAALFTEEDEALFQYFETYRSTLDATTDSDIFIGLPETENGVVKGLNKLFGAEGQNRFPGLKRRDLPCLWIEDEEKNCSIVKLPRDRDKLIDILRGVTDAAASARSFEEFEMEIEKLDGYPGSKPDLPPGPPPPPWFPVAGYVAAAVAFFFVAALVVIETAGKPVPSGARLLVDMAVSIALACGFAFIGGTAYAQGKIPFVKNYEPMQFTVGGGIAVFVVVFALLAAVYR